MALSANTVFEVRQAGNDTNGGGFVTGAAGTDYSQQNAKNVNGGTDGSSVLAVATGTTTITCADALFGTTIVGNIVYFSGGTGSIAGVWRQVTARASATSITIDLLIAASTGMTMNVGGALAGVGQASAIAAVSGQIVYVKYSATPYAITSATGGVAAGGAIVNAGMTLIGYNTTRTLANADALRPTLQAQVSTCTLVTTTGTTGSQTILNLIVDGNSGGGFTAVKGIASGVTGVVAMNCKAINCTNNGFSASVNCVRCVATGCSTQPAFSGVTAVGCESFGNSVAGFSSGASLFCLSYNNTGATSDGFILNARGQIIFNCTSYGNGRNGFECASFPVTIVGCIAESNTGVGFGNNGVASILSCFTYSNTGGASTIAVAGAQTLTQITVGTMFIAAASGNFALNNLVNQGALVRAADAALNNFPAGTTVGFSDGGAAQHADPTGTAGMLFRQNLENV
jgi:hypothetical protein